MDNLIWKKETQFWHMYYILLLIILGPLYDFSLTFNLEQHFAIH